MPEVGVFSHLPTVPDVDLGWPELVLHVLAHLDSTAELPSSLYSEAYVRAARQHIGPAEERVLGADIPVLAARLASHERLSRVQLLARLHPTLAAALGSGHLALGELEDERVANLAVRDVLVSDGEGAAVAELVRCAALLEAESWMGWPLSDLQGLVDQLDRALPPFWSIAPRLRSLRVRMLRVLGLRGRAWPDAIWVGVPLEQGEPSINHVLWQAAHEATVLEVSGSASALAERDVEQVAVALLGRRASGSEHRPGHQGWLRQMAPEVRRWAKGEGLSEENRRWLDRFALDSLERGL